MINFIHIIILSAIEGITEFLPISSSAHLIIAEQILGFEDPNFLFAVFIQFGAIMAVLWFYRKKFISICKSLFNTQQSSNLWKKFVVNLLIITTPTLIIGAIFFDIIKAYFFSLQAIITMLLIGGIIMIFIEKFVSQNHTAELEEITYRHALIIGLLQPLCLISGTSRSAVTIISGLISGLDMKSSINISFLSAIPVVSAAALYDLYKNLDYLRGNDYNIEFILSLIIAFFISFIAAILVLNLYSNLLQKLHLKLFGYYRIILAIILTFTLLP